MGKKINTTAPPPPPPPHPEDVESGLLGDNPSDNTNGANQPTQVRTGGRNHIVQQQGQQSTQLRRELHPTSNSSEQRQDYCHGLILIGIGLLCLGAAVFGLWIESLTSNNEDNNNP